MENKPNHAMCPVWSSVTNKSEGKMYGILLESVQFYVVQDVGEEIWHKILTHAGIKNMIFTTHTTYKDELMISLAKSCAHVTNTKDINEWMTFFGTCFVDFCSGYGYDKLLRVTGRNYRDFLHGIDNIHEIIRFSYPRMQSPSFLVMSEDVEGCVLLYQSKRTGFKHYVKGQLQQCAKKFYDVFVNITIIEEVFVEGRTHVKFRLDFDNSVYIPEVVTEKYSGKQEFSSITGDRFLQVFPFCIVFNNQLIIQNVGPSMAAFLQGDNLVGCNLRRKFHICRPLIPCIWSKILRFKRVIFELEYIREGATCDKEEITEKVGGVTSTYTTSEKNNEGRLLLRGEMKYIREWDKIAFLCKPLINDKCHLQSSGLFINDLNMFDMSRDMVMVGWQYASQLEFSIEKQRLETEIISENMTKIEEWKKKSNSLLYSMIPEAIAERLKSGDEAIDTCEVFDNVTIMFNYMVGFADICANATPMEIVTCINDVFILFDKIVDNYNVFKVETLGDAVYMVAGGVPDRSPDHARNVAGLALELQEKAKALIGPTNLVLNTRIGMHTGSVVGGVVGRRMPQYCLFGDTVNTASRMQTYSMPGRIHLSEPCYECLKDTDLVTVARGTVNIKGKGEMKTYWLAGKVGEDSTKELLEKIYVEKSQAVIKQGSYDNALDLHGMHASTSAAQISIDLEQRKGISPRKLVTKTGCAKNTLYNDKSSPRRKLFLSSLSNMLQVAEENESNLERTDISEMNKSTESVFGIQERLVSTPMDSVSIDSVNFFLNTEETPQTEETREDTDTDGDDNKDVDAVVEPVKEVHVKPDTPHKHSLQYDGVPKDLETVVEDDSCVTFSGCPLLSSLFKAPVLRCSTCTYVAKEEEIVEQSEKHVLTNTQPIPGNFQPLHPLPDTSSNPHTKAGDIVKQMPIDLTNVVQIHASSTCVPPLSNTAEKTDQRYIHTAKSDITTGQTTDLQNPSQIPSTDHPKCPGTNTQRYATLQSTPTKDIQSRHDDAVPPVQSNNTPPKMRALNNKTTQSCYSPIFRTHPNKTTVEVFPSLDTMIKRPKHGLSKCRNKSYVCDSSATKSEKRSLLANDHVSQNGSISQENDDEMFTKDLITPNTFISCHNGNCVMNSKPMNCGSSLIQSSECKTDFIKPQQSSPIEISQIAPNVGSTLVQRQNDVRNVVLTSDQRRADDVCYVGSFSHTEDKSTQRRHTFEPSKELNDTSDKDKAILNGNANHTLMDNGITTDHEKSDSRMVCPFSNLSSCQKGDKINRAFSAPLTTMSTEQNCLRFNYSDPGVRSKNSTSLENHTGKSESNV